MKKSLLISAFSLFLLTSYLLPLTFSHAQTGAGSSNPTQTNFQIVVCDGPHNPNGDAPVVLYDGNGKPTGATRPYVPCDFNAAMMQVQRLIDIAMVLGVLAAIGLFTYAGYLYMTGTQGNIDHAKSIFPKVFFGFIIMLTAWFIVFQILNWLTGAGMGSGFAQLLGK